MALEPHLKQQIRFQVEAGLEEVFRAERKGLDLLQGAFNLALSRQYQYFNRVKTNTRRRREKRKRMFGALRTRVDQSLELAAGLLPEAASGGVGLLRTAVGAPIDAIERFDGRLEDAILDRLGRQLNQSREAVDRVMGWADGGLKTHQADLNRRVRERLAEKLPLTEEEHFALAKDITHLVRRLEDLDQF